jgi:arylsulfatase A-like enzyme
MTCSGSSSIISDFGNTLQTGTVNELTSGVDILPTVCLLAGVEIPDQVSGKPVINRGGALFPEGIRDHILSEWDNDENSADEYVRCLRTKSEKLLNAYSCRRSRTKRKAEW